VFRILSSINFTALIVLVVLKWSSGSLNKAEKGICV